MTIRLPYPPSVNSYLKHTRKGVFRSKEANVFRGNVTAAVLRQFKQIPPMMTGRIAVSIELTMPDRRKRDIDNTQKVLLDALQSAGIYKDDCQIDYIQIRRLHVEAPGAADVVIEEIESD